MELLKIMSEEKLKEYFAFEAPYIEEKLYKEGKFNSKEEYESAFTELKKYFILLQTEGKDTPMMSEKVDAVWHQFILFTLAYHKFCNYYFGEYIHHLPNTSFTPIEKSGDIYFEKRYESVFGEVPSIWGLNSSCNGGGCGKCGGGNGCHGCSKCHSKTEDYDGLPYEVLTSSPTKTIIKTVAVEASCHNCNGCGHCKGCHGCRGDK